MIEFDNVRKSFCKNAVIDYIVRVFININDAPYSSYFQGQRDALVYLAQAMNLFPDCNTFDEVVDCLFLLGDDKDV